VTLITKTLLKSLVISVLIILGLMRWSPFVGCRGNTKQIKYLLTLANTSVTHQTLETPEKQQQEAFGLGYARIGYVETLSSSLDKTQSAFRV